MSIIHMHNIPIHWGIFLVYEPALSLPPGMPKKCQPRTCETDGDMREQTDRHIESQTTLLLYRWQSDVLWLPVHVVNLEVTCDSDTSLYCVSGLSKAQRSFSNTLTNFKFECIGNERTDDEKVIGKYSTFCLFIIYVFFRKIHLPPSLLTW